MKDYFIKEKFSLKRFGLESAILLFLVDSLWKSILLAKSKTIFLGAFIIVLNMIFGMNNL